MSPKATVLTAATDLSTGGTSEEFLGRKFDADVSFFLNHSRPGAVVSAHRHEYPEVFVVLDGEVTFTVDGESLPASGGQVVVVPAGATHGFTNPGPRTLEMVSIHPVAEMKTEWIEPS